MRPQPQPWSCGAGDRSENEKGYFDVVLAMLRTVAEGDTEEDAFEEDANEVC